MLDRAPDAALATADGSRVATGGKLSRRLARLPNVAAALDWSEQLRPVQLFATDRDARVSVIAWASVGLGWGRRAAADKQHDSGQLTKSQGRSFFHERRSSTVRANPTLDPNVAIRLSPNCQNNQTLNIPPTSIPNGTAS